MIIMSTDLLVHKKKIFYFLTKIFSIQYYAMTVNTQVKYSVKPPVLMTHKKSYNKDSFFLYIIRL